MKKLLFALLAIAVSPPIFAQNSGNITSNQSVCIGVSADHSTVAVQVTGTWTGTLQPQVAIQGQALTNSQVVPSTSTTPASTITANGVYYANVGGLSQFCILGNTVASGTAVVYLNASKGVNVSTLVSGAVDPATIAFKSSANVFTTIQTFSPATDVSSVVAKASGGVANPFVVQNSSGVQQAYVDQTSFNWNGPGVNLIAPEAGQFNFQAGNGTCDAPASGHYIGCVSSSAFRLSNNGDALATVARLGVDVPTPTVTAGLTTGFPFWLPYGVMPSSVQATTATVGTGNDINVLPVFLWRQLKVGHIGILVSTLQAATTCDVAVLDTSGNRLINTGGFSVASTGAQSIAITATTLNAGPYFMAYTCSGTTAVVEQVNIPADVFTVMNGDGTIRAGKSTTAATAGVIPSSVTLTLSGSPRNAVPSVMVTP